MNVLLIYFLYITNVLFNYISGELVELNHDYSNENTRTWPEKDIQKFLMSPIVNGLDEEGLWLSMYNFKTAEHSGTHMDAPRHFYEKGWTVDQIPLSHLFAPAIVIDIREKVKKNPMAALSVDDINKWVQEYGSIPNNSIVLVLTGWESRYNDSQVYYGIKGNKMTFPGIGLDAAKALLAISNLRIVGVGIDGPSTDVGSSVRYEAHRELLSANVYSLENLKNLYKLPAIGSELVVMPMKIKGGSGGPCRVIARISENGSNALLGSLAIMLASLSFLLRIRTTMFNLEGTEHNGTYLDAPRHFQKNGWTVDQIPLNRFFAPAAVFDIREKIELNPMAALSVDDINNWVSIHGSIPNNSIVLVITGWDSRYNVSKDYYGIHNNSKKIFPGIELEAAKELLSFRNLSIVGVGIDGPSVDVGSSVLYETHREFSAANAYTLENLKNIYELPPVGAELVVMPMKIKGGLGAPCRVIARIPDEISNSL